VSLSFLPYLLLQAIAKINNNIQQPCRNNSQSTGTMRKIDGLREVDSQTLGNAIKIES